MTFVHIWRSVSGTNDRLFLFVSFTEIDVSGVDDSPLGMRCACTQVASRSYTQQAQSTPFGVGRSKVHRLSKGQYDGGGALLLLSNQETTRSVDVNFHHHFQSSRRVLVATSHFPSSLLLLSASALPSSMSCTSIICPHELCGRGSLCT